MDFSECFKVFVGINLKLKCFLNINSTILLKNRGDKCIRSRVTIISIFTTIQAVTPTAACVTRKPHSRARALGATLIRNDDIYGPVRRLHRNELIGS